MPEAIYNEFLQYRGHGRQARLLPRSCAAGQAREHRRTRCAAFSAFTEGMQLFSSFVMLLNFTRNGTMKRHGPDHRLVHQRRDASHRVDDPAVPRIHCRRIPSCGPTRSRAKSTASPKRWSSLRTASSSSPSACTRCKSSRPQEVKHYIRYIADRRLTAMGMKAIFGVAKNPLGLGGCDARRHAHQLL